MLTKMDCYSNASMATKVRSAPLRLMTKDSYSEGILILLKKSKLTKNAKD